MNDAVPLSVAIITRNVSDVLPECLESVRWAGEVMVVDNHSTDQTLDIAKKFGATIYHDTWDREGSIRNRAYNRAKFPWVLTLDPDERVSDQLRQQIQEILDKGTEHTAFSVAMKSFFNKTYWIRHGGWYPASRVKLFRKDKFKYEDAEIHPRIILEGKEGRLSGDIIHYCYKDFSDVIRKMNVQSGLEAQKWLRDGRKMNWSIALVRTWSRFFKMFIQKKGYKDGMVGFMMAWQWAAYQMISFVKYWELKNFTSKK